MKRWTRCWAMLAPLSICASAAVGDTLESVEKTIVEQGKTLSSITSNSTYFMDNVSGTTKTHGEGETAYEYMRKGEKILYRIETSYTSVMETNGAKNTTKGTSLTVCDGDFNYMYSETNGVKSAMKMPATPGSVTVEQVYFDTMAQTYDLELMPDAKVGSHSTYVIRAVLKNPSPGMAIQQFFYFDKATGTMVKMVAKDSAGKVTMETLTTDLKVNSSISADRFVFTAPEGVEVTDLTQQPSYNAQPTSEKSSAGAEQSGEKPEKKPAKAEEKKAEKKKEKKSKWPKLPKKKWP